jgi:hypothetical protein
LETLRETKDSEYFLRAAREAAELRLIEALPPMRRRMRDFPQLQEKLVYLWYMADTDKVVPYARPWLNCDDEEARFWAAFILLRQGDKRPRTLAIRRLARAFERGEGRGRYWLMAVEPLLAVESDEAHELACRVLSHEDFTPWSHGGGVVLHQLLLAGRTECLDYLLRMLASQETAGANRPVCDRIAQLICQWRTDDCSYDPSASIAERERVRQELAEWLKNQFAMIKAGRAPTALQTEPRPLHYAPTEARFDAP